MYRSRLRPARLDNGERVDALLDQVRWANVPMSCQCVESAGTTETSLLSRRPILPDEGFQRLCTAGDLTRPCERPGYLTEFGHIV